MNERTDKNKLIKIYNCGQITRFKNDLFEASEYLEELKENCDHRNGEWCDFYNSECEDTQCDLIYIDDEEFWDEELSKRIYCQNNKKVKF